jgi:hypothetical protein
VHDTRSSQIDADAAQLSMVFVDNQVDFVPDPMVLRAAELLLLGRSGVKDAGLGDSVDADDVWEVIDRNLDGVLTFFHLLMTRERIPLIDYESTFPSTRFHDLLGDDLVVDIHPSLDLYGFLKAEARAKLNDLQLGSLPREMLLDITNELGTVGYEWYPDVGDLPDYQRTAAMFALGGIIFGGYAQATGTDHVLQTERARVFAELAVPQAEEPIWGFRKEREVFARLRELVSRDPRLAADDVALPPSALPHLLLSDPRDPQELLERALDLRDSDDGKLYREWHSRLRSAWGKGRRSSRDEDDIEDVRREIESRLASKAEGKTLWATTLDIEAGAGLTIGGKHAKIKAEIGPKVSTEVPVGVPNRLRNWLVDSLVFRRHKKLLLRMSLDQHSFDNVSMGLRELWMKG